MSDYTRVKIKSGPAAGQQINKRTAAMIAAAEKILGFQLTIVQGCFRAGHGAAASAGTHDKSGVVDFRVWGYPPHVSIDDVVKALRQVGFAAWHRTVEQFPTGAHIHAVAIGDKYLASLAAQQVQDYKIGRNGLANHGLDDGPQVHIRTWEQYQAAHPPKPSKPLTLFLHMPKGPLHEYWTKVAQRHLGIPVTGKFDHAMRRAVIQHRKRNKLGRPLGWVGKKLWKKWDVIK